MMAFEVPDGLSEIENELPLVMEMIARTARWVHPDTFKALPIWCPDTARSRPRYDAAWSKVLVSGKGVPKVEENIGAATALLEALGVKPPPKPKNWTVCHIWGVNRRQRRDPHGHANKLLARLHKDRLGWGPKRRRSYDNSRSKIELLDRLLVQS